MTHRTAMIGLLLSASLLAAPGSASVIGTNVPAQPITAERIAQLPAAQQPAWKAYLERSTAQEKADRAALAAELEPDQAAPPSPPTGHGDNGMALDRDAAWYASPEARHIADVIVSFQTPSGGWSKNEDRTGALRLPGQPWHADNNSKHLSEADFDAARDPAWGYVGTLDNNATITEMRFLAKVAGQLPGKEGEAYRTSFLKGVRYLLAAQFPNGGWPQVWPLEGGYHDAVTFNDNAVSEAADLLTEVFEAKADFAFVPADLRAKAGVAARKGREVIVASQIRVGGKLTIWGQQADPFTLAPVAGRNFEPPALSTGESADLLVYLMSLPDPTPAEVAAVHAGVAWLKGAAIMGKAWTGGKGDPEGRRLVDQPGAGPLWSRYYDTAGQPVFGERDKTLRDNANELSLERRNGYSWFGTAPAKAIKAYEGWAKSHPAT
ncbi:pectate lyase [Caulobacter sp. FWC2]|uniref:pectate lyase n=1 Tax=Caulobacter sp. FWC2 TaxID=69664 RepID=UPI000C155C2D|nr:pectate lyase [Caulobacter sp. FWC2]PIB91181.1 pectate lyase [Caulobacter sp. FWC2]